MVVLAGLGFVLAATLGYRMILGQSASGERPRLVLVLSIDQMRFDYLTRFDELYTGGLRRLLDDGAVFTNARYRHASTETGPGHSVILSGRHPSHSGIVGNSWFDPFTRRTVGVVSDPFVQPVGGAGASASPSNFVGFTLGDTLKTDDPNAHVVTFSFKDRSAILMGGRLADGAYWYESQGGNFITSSYYTEEPPAWLIAWNDRHVADGYRGRVWTRLLPDEFVYEEFAGPDQVEGESNPTDRVFPHALGGNPPERGFYDSIRRTPFADQITLDAALAGADANGLGQDDVPDILAIGFSGTDIIGHAFGPDSQEVMDQLLRLDLLLGDLFETLDTRVGLSRVLVVLTADHGAMPLVENLQARGIDARRLPPSVLRNAVMTALDARFDGGSEFILSFGTDIYLDRELIRERAADPAAVEEVITDALFGTGVVAAVYTAGDLAGDSPSDDPYIYLYRNAYYSSRSPDLAVRLNEYIYPGLESGGGTGHGTAYDFDRHVPIIFMGSAIRPGRYESEAGPTDIAPTLAAILGLDFPQEYDARILEEALRR